ncbi:MAG TPA: hypothetical protein VFR67_03085 [Pilimelia sp.]|nr:hypothetical protein [Pilimelia sp.]
MSPDVSPDADDARASGLPEAGEPAVVAWGDDEAPADRRVARVMAGWRSNRRLVPIVAGIGAMAAAGSVLSEWRVTTAQIGTSVTGRASAGVVGFPAAGTTYLLGLLVIGACLVLTLYGVGLVRHHARLVGLTATAVVGLTLIATSADLDQMVSVSDAVQFGPDGPDGELVMSAGRGLYLAYAAVAALAFALWLAAPAGHGVLAEPADAAEPGEVAYELDDFDPADGELGPDWPWQRSHRSPRADDSQRPAPLDLTVEASTPFVSPPDERDTR